MDWASDRIQLGRGDVPLLLLHPEAETVLCHRSPIASRSVAANLVRAYPPLLVGAGLSDVAPAKSLD